MRKPSALLGMVISSLLLFRSLFCNATGPSSEPYLSGDTWRHHVNHVLSDVEKFDPSFVELGDTIFVEQDSLNEFHTLYSPKIKKSYILVTANCDRGGDEALPGRYSYLLNDPNLYAWFTQNLDRSDDPRLHPIPIGIANRKYPWGNIDLYNRLIPEARTRQRTQWVYVNFSIHTNPQKRQPCWDYFAKNLSEICYFSKFKKHYIYVRELPNHFFVISPQGNGLDCHRTWEALLFGSYPVVLSSTLNPLYENLPVVVVNKWEEVTFDLLQNKLNEFQNRSWNLDKLYFAYWLNQVLSLQKNLREGSK